MGTMMPDEQPANVAMPEESVDGLEAPQPDDTEKRVATLYHLLETFRTDDDDKPHNAPVWEAWLRATGELPPNFDALPTNAFLPDVLTFADGTRVASAEDWRRRRHEILGVLQYYQLGAWPPPPPKMAVETLGHVEDTARGGTVHDIALLYAPTVKALDADLRVPVRDECMFRSVRLRARVYIPVGEGPFPAIVEVGSRSGDGLQGSLSARMTGREHVVCTFDQVDAFTARDVYPLYDCNQLVWWAYAASRCIDYLIGLPEVDASRIAVIGHSRGAKMAAISGAIDERVAATIASHAGAGAGTVTPWRYLGEKFGGETLESSTLSFPYWNQQRLRFFAGRENALPFDAHWLLALIAPRALLVTEGDADDVGEPWGTHQAYKVTRDVYALLDHPDQIGISYSTGGHRLPDEVIAHYEDWLAMQWGRKPFRPTEELMYTYTFDGWRAVTGETVDVTACPEKELDDLLIGKDGEPIRTGEAWQARTDAIKERVRWVIGELPRGAPLADTLPINVREIDLGLNRAELPIDADLTACLTYRAGTTGKLPVVIFLHAYVDAMGHASTDEYGYRPLVGERIALAGFLAVEFDLFGYGRRNRDAGIEFFQRNPAQSAMSVMVRDVQAIVDRLQALGLADADNIMLAGFSLGGAVALHAAALDRRVKAVASTCGFASMRLDAHGQATEGLARYSHLRPTLPKLGFFVGHERHVPYDYHEILALIAPRPVLIVAPLLDQDWVVDDVRACVDAASEVYQLLGARENLRLETPNDFNRYPPSYQALVNRWLSDVVRSGTGAA